MNPYNQCDPRYGSHALGTIQPGTICQYGCLECDFATVTNNTGHPNDPVTLDNLLAGKGLFLRDSTGTLDLLSDNTLDKLYPGEYQTTTYTGFRADVISAGVRSADTWVVLWISGYSPYWGMNIVTHFVIAWTPDGAYIGDPEGGTVRALSAYGGAANVHRTIAIKHIKPAPAPPPAPAPAPTYTVVLYSTGVVMASGLTYPAAVVQAQQMAKAHVGVLFEVRDQQGHTVDTEFIALPPAPVPPAPTPQPTPPPSLPPTLADAIDQILVAIILFFKYRVHQGKF